MPRRLFLALLPALLLACSEAEEPPSILLFVFDTTRGDDPSFVDPGLGTTPYWDGLAEDGLVYTRSFAQAPWTLPSHASMFTGRVPSQHGVGWTTTRASDSLETVAERLAAGGYQTLAVSENPWLTETFNLLQGFEETFFIRGEGQTATDAVADWLERKRPDSPFFVFVNVVDPHAPYVGNSDCRFPEGMSLRGARQVAYDPRKLFCTAVDEGSRERLKALHRCDLLAADEKLASIHALLREADPHLVSVVTADHGEHFGEHGLVSHQFSVRNELLEVPLVVHGLRGTEPGTIDEPVAGGDIAPSLLEWAGLPGLPGIEGRALPIRMGEVTPRAIVSEYVDLGSLVSESEMGRRLLALGVGWRTRCGDSDPVFGSMRSIIRFPHKAIAYENYQPELFDLSTDPAESTNLAETRSAILEGLLAELPQVDAHPAPSPEWRPGPSPEILESLEALGYLGSAEPEPEPEPWGGGASARREPPSEPRADEFRFRAREGGSKSAP